MPTPLLPQDTLDLTGLDREGMLVRIQKLFNQANPGYEDFTPNFPENLLLEGTVVLVDTQRAVLENRVRQLMWSTVEQRLAAIRLGRLSRFSLTGGSAATVTLRFTATDAATIAKIITLAEGLRVRTNDPQSPQRYTTIEAVTKAAGIAYIEVIAKNSEPVEEAFDSLQSPNQEYVLNQKPYVDGTAVITDSNGSFELVDSFLELTSDGTVIGAASRVCVVMIDDQDRLVVRFGNGVTGAIPQGTITVNYEIGGGADGAVAGGTDWSIEDTITDTGGDVVSLICSNALAAAAGSDPMTVDEARVLGPLSMRTINRCVTAEDFEYVARLVPGIARAAMITSDNDPTVQEDHGSLYLVTYGTRLTSGRYAPDTNGVIQTKLDAVTALIAPGGRYPAVMGIDVVVGSAPFKTIDVYTKIYKRSGHSATDVRTSIEDALADFLAVSLDDKTPNPDIDFGFRLLNSAGEPNYLLAWSDFFNAVRDATGVRMVEPSTDGLLLNSSRSAVLLKPYEFPALGSVQIRDMDTGLDI